jgi:hypothetical protein
MPWSKFKDTILNQMNANASGGSGDLDAFAKLFAETYDAAIKSGKDMINPIPIGKGNVDKMQEVLSALLKQTQKSTGLTLLDVVGPAVIVYWTGARMQSAIPPNIPAPGSIKNIVTITGLVLNPGVWTPLPVPPNNNTSIFLDAFINAAKIHLTTVSGLYVVLAQYPPPAPPAAGIVNWSGYKVPD